MMFAVAGDGIVRRQAPKALTGDEWWPVYGLDGLETARRLQRGDLHPDDWSDAQPHQTLLELAVISEIEDAQAAVEDGAPYDPAPIVSGLLLAFGANPATVTTSSVPLIDLCESVAPGQMADMPGISGRVRHPRCAALVRRWLTAG